MEGQFILELRCLRGVFYQTMNSCGQMELISAKKDAECLCEWIRDAWGVEPVCLEQPHGHRSVVAIYFDTLAEAEAHRRKLPRKFDLSSVQTMACHEEQWTTFWRHHFHIQDIGRRLRTVPVWETPPDRKRINLRIDPGLSFGTGGHFTTRFCLEELERACAEFNPRSMLDVGTGSGILAIAAAKLGVARVEAFDNDPVCVAKCRENAALNRLGKGRIRFYSADVLQEGGLKRMADVVCANILTNILIEAAPSLWKATKKRLILTGIREFEGDAVADAFMTRGAREVLRDGDGEWCGIILDRP
jgi:ribosomal protein L11 methyltransferase